MQCLSNELGLILIKPSILAKSGLLLLLLLSKLHVMFYNKL